MCIFLLLFRFWNWNLKSIALTLRWNNYYSNSTIKAVYKEVLACYLKLLIQVQKHIHQNRKEAADTRIIYYGGKFSQLVCTLFQPFLSRISLQYVLELQAFPTIKKHTIQLLYNIGGKLVYHTFFLHIIHAHFLFLFNCCALLSLLYSSLIYVKLDFAK